MKNTKKNHIQKEKKIHPFLFIILLFFVGLLLTNLWSAWGKRTAQQELQDVIRSGDIEILLDGGTFSQNDHMDTLSEQFLNQNETAQTVGQEDISNNDSNTNNTNDTNDTNDKNLSSNNIPHSSNGTVNLALRSIFISQGANGVENWRLIAEWATLRQTTSVLNLSKPSLLYNTKNQDTSSNNSDKTIDINQNEKKAEIKPFKIIPREQSKKAQGDKKFLTNTENPQEEFFNNAEEMVLITAENGIIFDNNTKIHLTENVVAKQKTTYARGNVLDYSDDTKIATFPASANFAGKNIHGTASVLSWDLNKNQLIGTNKVKVTWTPSKK